MYCLQYTSSHLLQHDGIEVSQTKNPKPKPESATLEFGKHFSDHMLLVNWSKKDGWDPAKIVPFGNLSLSPGVCCLHYAIEVLKA